MQQEQDNEFTRAEEIRKLHVIPELVSHHLEIRAKFAEMIRQFVNSIQKLKNGKHFLLKSSTLVLLNGPMLLSLPDLRRETESLCSCPTVLMPSALIKAP